MRLSILTLILAVLPCISFSYLPWQSAIVYYGSNDKLSYASDLEFNRIPDFSWAGYKNSNEKLPDVRVVKTLSLAAGDNTSRIQVAINEVSAMAPDADGFRGTLLLTAGRYEVYGSLTLNASGVVIRGAGDGSDPLTSTILWARGSSSSRTVLTVGGGNNTKWADGSGQTNITTQFVQVGSRSFTVQDASTYNPGDNIIIQHPCSQAWINAVDCGGTANSPCWTAGAYPLVFNRYILEKSGNTLTIDAPVFNHLDRAISQSYIYHYGRSGIRTNIGIERLRIDIETFGEEFTGSAAAASALYLCQIEDSWVKKVTVMHHNYGGVRVATGTRITIDSCTALDPWGDIIGGNRYSFVMDEAQLVLVSNCYGRNARHHYVIGMGKSWASGNVFYNCISDSAYLPNEGHMRWSMGQLWDNISCPNHRHWTTANAIAISNIGDAGSEYGGSGHGWGNAHSVAWHCDASVGTYRGASNILIQKPPTAQNYGIGNMALMVTGAAPPALYDQPEGYIEGTNRPGIYPPSLYAAQLADRIGSPVRITSIDIVPREEMIECFPNPFNGTAIIRFPNQAKSATVKIFNIMGQQAGLFEHVRGNEVVWNAADRASGRYIIFLETGNRRLQTTAIFGK